MKALKDQMLICDIESDDNKVGWRKRRDAMEDWINTYVQTVDTQQSVLNPKVFDSGFMDFIKESLAKNLAEELTTTTKYDITDNNIKAKIVVINGNR
jgi:hypothetical protein